ncbi:MAG: hypothetical protein GXP53_09645 [Deltaproteobacteria bacterium]|nr:hypothetical protein [Deltaproteobacteria bacterium]
MLHCTTFLITVDGWIVNHVQTDDIKISADIPIASRCRGSMVK